MVNACRAVQEQVDGQKAASAADTFNNALDARSGFSAPFISAMVILAAFSLIIETDTA
jgi:hypothetical protein